MTTETAETAEIAETSVPFIDPGFVEHGADLVGGGFRTTSIRVQNDNEHDLLIFHLYIRPSSQLVWGKDRLGERVLGPKEWVVVEVLPGYYDILATTSDGTVVMEERSARVTFNDFIGISNIGDWGRG
jgi:hypothetical protein